MTSAGIFNAKIRINQRFCQSRADDSGTEDLAHMVPLYFFQIIQISR